MSSRPTSDSSTAWAIASSRSGQAPPHVLRTRRAESAAYRDFWASLNRGEYIADRFKRIDAHGRTVWLEASYNPVHDAYGKLYKVIKFATVITDQVNRELAVAEAATIAYDTSHHTDLSAQRGAGWSSRPSM